MTKALVAVAAAAMAVTAVFWGASARAAGEEGATLQDGRELFATYCASCHGRDARGNGPVADTLRDRPADLTQFAKENGGTFPAERTRRVVDGRESRVRAHGSIEMPVWGDAFVKREGLSDAAARERIDAIVRFLESVQERTGH